MNVVLLADSDWLEEELHSLQHLIVGLVDERIRVIQAVPDDAPAPPTTLTCQKVTWSESRWTEMNRWRLRGLEGALQPLEPSLIHCLTSGLWRPAVELGEELSVPVVLGAGSHAALDRVDRTLRDANPARIAFAAGTEPIAQALRQRVDPAIVVAHVPVGAHVSEEGHGCAGADSLCGIVSGDGEMDEHYEALLRGLASIIERHPSTQFFFEGRSNDQHELWRSARKLGLLANISMIPRRLGHRELLLSADVMLHPQPLGTARTITLEAMAHGLAVIAHHDPWLDYLHPDQTAWVLKDPTADDWRRSLERVIDEPQAASELGARARQWVREGRLVSDQLAKVVDLYRRVTGATLAFKASA